jgi:formamidopyrimidine-DNA glycosylase
MRKSKIGRERKIAMPELPEVETVRRIVAPQIIDRTIQKVEILNDQIVAYPDAMRFAECLSGQKFSGMDRRGKFLIFRFESGNRLFLHLRMTGQLLVTPVDYPAEKHTHLVLHLDHGMQLRYIDVRRFGRFWYLGKDESESVTGIDKLGLEPFDSQFTAEYLKSRLSQKKKSIKEMLHDQSVVAGIGNIYSDEILYLCGIYPETKCTELTDADFECPNWRA